MMKNKKLIGESIITYRKNGKIVKIIKEKYPINLVDSGINLITELRILPDDDMSDLVKRGGRKIDN